MTEQGIFVLDVGHGSCVACLADNRALLIDAGPGGFILEFLRSQGVSEIETVLISHADADHLRGLVALLAAGDFRVADVRLNSDGEKDSKVWPALLYELDAQARAGGLHVGVALIEGEQFSLSGSDITLEVVGPRLRLAGLSPGGSDLNGRVITSNTVSAVVRVLFGGRPVALVCGDVDELGLDHLLDAAPDMAAPTLVFPHHGGKPAAGNVSDERMARFTDRLCDVVRPETVVFSTGRSMYDTPRPAIVAAMRARQADVRVVCTQLSTHCAAQVPGVDPQHLLPVYARGRLLGECCGGTVQLLTSSGVTPSQPAHLEFILNSAPTALCQG